PTPFPELPPIEDPPVASASARAGSVVVRQSEIDDAIASGMKGASVHVARDPNGAPVGLAIDAAPPLLTRYGIRAGDVLLSANGMPLRTPDEALAALGTLQRTTKVV